MQNLVRLAVVGCTLAFLVAGCGKSADEKKAETDLSAEIMSLHEQYMAPMAQINDLAAQIDAALTLHAQLATAHPKDLAGTSTDNLTSARGLLMTGRGAMENWMADYRPYDESMRHEDAMAKLAKDKQGLLKAGVAMQTGISAATTALIAEHTVTSAVLAKYQPKGTKGKS